VSGTRQAAIVTRDYRPAPDNCARALELLLKKSASKEGGPVLAAPDDTRGESKRVSRARRTIP
jgi:hypothetical protein